MRFLYIAAAMLFVSPLSAEATETKHFNPKSPKNFAEAIAALQVTSNKMAEAIKADDMTKVHKLSYALEAAIEVIEEEIEVMEEQVEEIHEASEHGENATAKEEFEAFLPKVQALSK